MHDVTGAEPRAFASRRPAALLFSILFIALATWLFLQTKHSWSPWGLAASGGGALLASIGGWRSSRPAEP